MRTPCTVSEQVLVCFAFAFMCVCALSGKASERVKISREGRKQSKTDGERGTINSPFKTVVLLLKPAARTNTHTHAESYARTHTDILMTHVHSYMHLIKETHQH